MPAKKSKGSSLSLEWIVFISLLIIGLLLIGFFGLRSVRSYNRIQQTGLQVGVADIEAIRGWMTIPYIARAYRVPEPFIFEQLDIPVEGNRKKSLKQLNRQWAPGDQQAILEAVKEAIRTYQKEQPPPRGGGP